jgi:hypothetical protein
MGYCGSTGLGCLNMRLATVLARISPREGLRQRMHVEDLEVLICRMISFKVLLREARTVRSWAQLAKCSEGYIHHIKVCVCLICM